MKADTNAHYFDRFMKEKVERETGLEPATTNLEGWSSTN
jgi:hypothetical protein